MPVNTKHDHSKCYCELNTEGVFDSQSFFISILNYQPGDTNI